MEISPIQIDDRFNEDWGEIGRQWTGEQIQSFIKEQFRLLIESYNNLVKSDTISNAVKRMVITGDVGASLQIDTDKSSFSDIIEIRNYLNKIWTGEDVFNLAIIVNKDSQWRVFKAKGLFFSGSDYHIMGTVATGTENISAASIIVKPEDIDYTEYNSLALTTLSALKEKLDKYPTITPEIASDNKTYGLKNGQLEEIAGENEFVWTGKEVTYAAALSLVDENAEVKPVKLNDSMC